MTFGFLILFFLIPTCCLGLLFHGKPSVSNSSTDGQDGNKLDASLIHQLLAKEIGALENKFSGLTQKVATLERNIYDSEVQNFTQEMNNIRKQTKLCEQKLQAYEEGEANDTVKWQNIVNVVDKLKDQVRYATLSLLDMSAKTKEMNFSLIQAKSQISDVVGNLTNLQGGVSTVQYNVSSLFSALNSLHMQISDSSKKVAFSAGVRSSNTSWNSGILVFDEIIYSVGGGYSPTTGVFTAPTHGTYAFYVKIQGYSVYDIQVDVVLNGISKARLMVYNLGSIKNDFESTSSLVLLGLQHGDKVWVKHYYGQSYHTQSITLTIFSGFLI